ncbi:MAG TPA: hypothetical protein VN696_14440 [Pyrinomonadaceae bacterium]|nr:hypothetical protein [Pyrinomonadaceae bacterium]
MIASLWWLDVRPDPVPTGSGITVLILIGIVVLMLSVAAIVGFVFLLRWFLCAKAASAQTPATAEFQPNSPNQP